MDLVPRRSVVRGAGFDGEGVDVGFHEIPDGVVNEPMSFQRRKPGKFVRDQRHPEVPLAIPGTGVAGMQMALIFNFKRVDPEGPAQAAVDLCNPVGSHGNTYLKGLTMTSA